MNQCHSRVANTEGQNSDDSEARAHHVEMGTDGPALEFAWRIYRAMPLPGGAAEKFGNRYEGRWTVACLLDVMDERADSIRLEPPGPEGQGVEFWITKQGVREYHQVKRQHSNGHWTLHTLAAEGVLTNFITRLQDPSVRCVFVSGNSAGKLYELSDRARRAASWEEYYEAFLDGDQWKKNFGRVQHSAPDVQEQDVYERLKRVDTRNIDESFLLTTIESRVTTLVDGDPATAVDVLAELALERVHHKLTTHDIWNHLETRGFSRRHWDKDPHVLSAVGAANQRYLSLLRNQAIGHTILPRHEVQTIQGRLKESGGKVGVLLTGEAGIGKSGVMLQVVEELLDAGTPVVAFRTDRLEPTQLPDKVGEQIGLPGSPADVLAAVAQGGHCVLVIDQVDALSLASGRNTDLFDCIYEILRQAQGHPNVRILLACRKFDLDNDHRLRGLTDSDGIAEAVVVGRLPHETVHEVVAGFGLNADSLSFRQRNLLSVPLHLKLLSELVADVEIRRLNFETAQDLYERFWVYKQQVIRERVGQPVQWTQVVYGLCDYMHEHQILSAPEVVVEEWGSDTSAMVSENVLVLQDKRYSFFHEGFFDYVFARHFAGSPQSLLDLLVSGEQRLFRRAQVRQILLYLRGTDFDRYIDDLKEVLSSPDVRFHIKQVVFALLADLSEPGKREWDVVSLFAGKDFNDSLTRQAWMTVRRLAWFRLVDSLGLVQQWLDDPDEAFVDQTVLLLRVIQRELPNRVAELVETYVDQSECWNTRLLHLAVWGDWSQGRSFLELMLRLIDEGVLDDARGPIAINSDFWSLLYPLPDGQPSWGCEVVGHYFNRRHQLSLGAGQPNPFDYSGGTIANSQSVEDTLSQLAANAPGSFVREVMPFMQGVIEDCASRERGELLLDPVWSNRVFQSGYTTEDALLMAMETALSKLAVQDPPMYQSAIEPIRDSPYETIQYLLIRSLSANGALFANDAVDHLCAKPDRLEIGYSSEPHWATRQLIESISLHCSDEKLQHLEETLLGYYPDWERTILGRRQHGYAQFTLLSGITSTRLSLESNKRLKELRRKFGQPEPDAPTPMKAEEVPSPIPEQKAEKMTDGQWLSAIHQHDDERAGIGRDGHLIGGARELSRVLENQVKQEPRRFAELLSEFPDDANPSYFEAVLRGTSDSDLDAETVVRVCERCHRLEGRPLGREICDLISGLAKGRVPAEALDLVAWYATEDPDPQQELWRKEVMHRITPEAEYYYNGNILTNGINTSRGRAAQALARLVESDQQRTTHFQPVLEKMVQDPSMAVRSCVAQALTAVLRFDRDLAVELFRQLCNTEDALLSTPFIERFVCLALQTHFRELAPILERMVNSEMPDVASTGARQAYLAALDLPEAAAIAEACLSGSESQRLGAAQVVAANIKVATCRSFCEDALISMFNDPNERIRSEAANCFRRFEGDDLIGYEHLIAEFIISDAFVKNHFPLLMALERTTAKLPAVTLSACEMFIDLAGLAAGDISTREAGDAATVVKLTLRTYQQSSDDTIWARSLDLADRLMELSAYGIHDAIEEVDR